MSSKYTFFFGQFNRHGYCSNWAEAPFKIGRMEFNCVEQCMMYYKAVMFGDAAIADRVMGTLDPKTHKALGKQVNGFVESIWNASSYHIVYGACKAKFAQNETIRNHLLALPKDTILVEASPYDKIWGTGWPDTKCIMNPGKWPGENRLGLILTQVKREFV